MFDGIKSALARKGLQVTQKQGYNVCTFMATDISAEASAAAWRWWLVDQIDDGLPSFPA